MIIDSKHVDTAEQVPIIYTDIVSLTDLIDKVGDGYACDQFNEHDQFEQILEVNELKSRTLMIP